MRQKYVVFNKKDNQKLVVQEFAELEPDIFFLLKEEAYPGDRIESAVSQGRTALIDAIRTPNLYPTSFHADKIVDKILELYESPGDGPREIVFDEIRAIRREELPQFEEEEEEVKDETEELDSLFEESKDYSSPGSLRISDDDSVETDEE